MSTSPYSIDLRERVIKYIESGKSKKAASILFKLNPKTVYNWYNRYKVEGHCLPRKRMGATPKINTEEFINYVNKTPNATSEDIGEAFNLSASGARYWLRKLGYSYKKKTSLMWKQTKKGEKNIKKR